MTTELNSRIRKVVGITGLNFTEFSEQTGVSASSLKTWANYASDITQSSARKLSQALAHLGVQVSTLWISTGMGEPPRIKSEYEQEEKPAVTTPDDIQSIDKEITRFANINVGAITLMLEDNSMQPCYRQGDYIGGLLIAKENIAKLVNQNCIIKLVGYNTLCRKLVYYDDKYSLIALNLNDRNRHNIIQNLNIEFIASVTRVWHG